MFYIIFTGEDNKIIFNNTIDYKYYVLYVFGLIYFLFYYI